MGFKSRTFSFFCLFQARHLGEPASCFISVAVARANETVWEDYSYLAGLVGKRSPFYADCLTPRWAVLLLSPRWAASSLLCSICVRWKPMRRQGHSDSTNVFCRILFPLSYDAYINRGKLVWMYCMNRCKNIVSIVRFITETQIFKEKCSAFWSTFFLMQASVFLRRSCGSCCFISWYHGGVTYHLHFDPRW